MKKHLEEVRAVMEEGSSIDECDLECIVRARILFPDEVNEKFLGPKIMQKIEQEVERLRLEAKTEIASWSYFFEFAAHLQILSAERLEFGKDGLRLVMPEKNKYQKKEIGRPVRKQF